MGGRQTLIHGHTAGLIIDQSKISECASDVDAHTITCHEILLSIFRGALPVEINQKEVISG
jgi:hypothetical protein